MAKVIEFNPRKLSMEKESENNYYFGKAMQNIEERFGISFYEYIGLEGNKEEVDKKMTKAMHKELLELNTRYNGH